MPPLYCTVAEEPKLVAEPLCGAELPEAVRVEPPDVAGAAEPPPDDELLDTPSAIGSIFHQTMYIVKYDLWHH